VALKKDGEDLVDRSGEKTIVTLSQGGDEHPTNKKKKI
jgi:hypothetical protein